MPVLTGLARLGRDAEVEEASNGQSVAKLSLAFNVLIKGERGTQWVSGSLWGKRAEKLAQYLKKGAVVSVTLSDVHVESFTNRDGEAKSALVGQVVDIELGPRTDAAPAAAPTPPPAPKPAPRPPAADPAGFDDIPF